MTTSFLFCAIVALLIFSACASKSKVAEEDLLGLWRDASGFSYLEFFDDHTYQDKKARGDSGNCSQTAMP